MLLACLFIVSQVWVAHGETLLGSGVRGVGEGPAASVGNCKLSSCKHLFILLELVHFCFGTQVGRRTLVCGVKTESCGSQGIATASQIGRIRVSTWTS